MARSLGIWDSSLGDWVKQAKTDAGKGPPDALSSAEKDELRRLRRENKQLKQERDILKKAAAFFANEQN